MESNQSIAFFDMDGTITKSDTFFHFLLFDKGWGKIILGGLVLAPWLFLYRAGLITASSAKQRVFRFFFKGRAVNSLEASGNNFCVTVLPRLLKEDMLNQIDWHKKLNHTVCVVTASSNIWLKSWCESNGLHLISTEYEHIDGFFSGDYLTPNCNGEEKVNRIRKIFELDNYQCIYAYGNSTGDNPMLQLKK